MEDFIAPPEAPVFHPTPEEFADPIAYLTKIRPVVVNTGICKIRPPSGWKPPFSLDLDTFSFTPRLQPLNELEAKTRVKLNFLEQLAKFWELQGVSFKIPNVDRSPMDLHTIFKAVTGFGGFKEMTKQRKWSQLARELGYEGVGVAGTIRQNYEKYLYPYEVFLAKRGTLQFKSSPQKSSSSTTSSPNKSTSSLSVSPPSSSASSSSSSSSSSLTTTTTATTTTATNASQSKPCKYGLRQNRRRLTAKGDPDYSVEMESDHPEFKKLAFTSPGPKNAFAPLKRAGYHGTKQLLLHHVMEEEGGGGGEGGGVRGGVGSGEGEEKVEGLLDGASISVATTAEVTHIVKQEQPVSDGLSSSTTSPPTDQTMTSSSSTAMTSSASTVTVTSEGIKTEQVSMLQEPDLKLVPVEEVKCEECGSGDYDEELLLCDGCDASFHTFCLDPPLPSIPPGDWRCPTCVAQACIEDQEAFGFEQSKRTYSLPAFGERANQFKSFYFKKHPTDVPCSTVEKEFWRLVSSIEDDVTVEYGADLHTSQHGSGFPTTSKRHSRAPAMPMGANQGDKSTEQQQEEEEEEQVEEDSDYLMSGWNLNNISNLKGSILRYISADISGMKVPWLYIGMCFSCFCWHIEDHWSYSINYLHWGEPKTWYGVPPAFAESLEATMKDQAPELFENHPDLMHHLATILSPAVLLKHGIPVVRTDQCEGEFVVTFPRAYHAGFNQGFNCAEAVNFLLGDWLPIGRQSIDHYRSLSRTPVFSHDELLCKMVAQPDKLELCLLPTSSEDMARMTSLEEQLRRDLREIGLVQEQREVFELSSDEDRLCCVCSTYCFLSAIRCPCNPKKLVCANHSKEICDCSPSKKVLRYRYTIEELRGMLTGVQKRSRTYSDWCREVDTLLDAIGDQKCDLQHLRSLLEVGSQKNFTNCPTYEELRDTIREVEESASVAVQLTRRGRKEENKGGGGDGGGGEEGMDLDNVKQFLRHVETLPCKVPEAKLLENHLNDVEVFQEEARVELQRLTQQAELQQTHLASQLNQLLTRGEDLGIAVPELDLLRVAVQQSQWVVETESKLKLEVLTMESLRRLLKQASAMDQSRVVDLVTRRIRELLTAAHDWESEVKTAIKQKPPHPASYLENLLARARHISVQLPSRALLVESLDRGTQWKQQAQQLQDNDSHPHYDHLKRLLSSGRPIPVKLDLLAQLESRHAAAKGWVDRAGRTFIKKNSSLSLLEVLLPRTKAVIYQRFTSSGKSTKKKSESSTVTVGELEIGKTSLSDLDGDRLKEMEKIHAMEEEETKLMKQLRNDNLEKMEQDEGGRKTNSQHSPVLYCFCRKPESGYMLQCELCNEWYHATCLHIPKGKRTAGKDIGKDSRFLCALCLRTRRPRLDAIVSLLISLQKVPVAISEGTALHCLAERAISWQKRARSEITNCNTVLEAAKQQMRRVDEVKAHIGKWKAEMQLTAEERQRPTSIEAQLASSAGSVLAHYDSELQRLRSDYAGLSGCKRETLEHLLMEGDLLEVTMDEVQQLWQLLQLDTEYLSAFDSSPAKLGGRTATVKQEVSSCQVEEKQLRRRKRSVVSPSSSSDGSITPSSKRRRTPVSSSGSTTPQTRLGSVKRETTPTTPKPALSPQLGKQLAKQLSTVAAAAAAGGGGGGGGVGGRRKRPSVTLRQRASGVKTRTPPSSQDLGCHEQIEIEDEEEEGEDEEEEEEEEGECSATQCLQPVTDQIIWVQCDHCHEWFHCVCVGLTKEYAEQIDIYKCASCKQTTISPNLAAASVSSNPAATSASSGVSVSSRINAKIGSLLSSFSSSPSSSSASSSASSSVPISQGQT